MRKDLFNNFHSDQNWSPGRWLLPFAYILAIALRCYDLGRSITDPYSFRQTQTAWLIRHLAQDGLDLLSGYLPVLGSPWQLPFEFPLYQNLAAIVTWSGVSVEFAGRLVSICCCILSAHLLYLLGRAHFGGRIAFVATLVFLFVPYSIFWSTTILMDFLALASALGFLLAISRFSERGSIVSLLVAATCGGASGAIKLPSLLFYAIPAGALLLNRWQKMRRSSGRQAIRVEVLLVALAGFSSTVPFLLWTWYADSVKRAQPFTVFAISSNLHEWYFGSLEQFLDGSAIARVLARMLENFGFLGAALFFVVGIAALVFNRSQRVFAISMLLQALFTVAVFRNLHLAHHYYQIAILPAVSLFTGAGILVLFTLLPRAKLFGTVLALLVLVIVRLPRLEQYLAALYFQESVPHEYIQTREWGLFLKAHTKAEDLIAIVGLETWDPAILYAAERRGFMVREARNLSWQQYITQQHYAYLFFVSNAAVPTSNEINGVLLERVGEGKNYTLMRLRYEQEAVK